MIRQVIGWVIGWVIGGGARLNLLQFNLEEIAHLFNTKCDLGICLQNFANPHKPGPVALDIACLGEGLSKQTVTARGDVTRPKDRQLDSLHAISFYHRFLTIHQHTRSSSHKVPGLDSLLDLFAHCRLRDLHIVTALQTHPEIGRGAEKSGET